jgi:hypothetical protein
LTGFQGDTGASGPQGPSVNGPQGAQGASGAAGIPGPTGPSDRRFKKNIREIESPLSKVQKMRGVSFIWNNSDVNEKPKKDIGFIAQEVEHVFPELVFKISDNEDSKYMVKYNDIIAICLEAIKEQSDILNNSLTKLERLEGLVTEKGV